MNRIRWCLSALLLAIAAAPAWGAAAAPENPVEVLVRGNRTFAVKLYQELGASKGNLFFSPHSVSTALGMTYAGARGNTAEEMKAALEFPTDTVRLHPAFRSLNQEIGANARRTGQKLTIANGLVLAGGDVGKPFKALLRENYDAELFAGRLEKINEWVRAKTEGKIDRILETLDPNSVCVILNAVYFKGAWDRRFEAEATHEAPFHLSPTEAVQVPLMVQRSPYRLLAKPDFQAISMPYQGNAFSMILFLPQEVDGLDGLEKRLTPESLMRWLEELDGAPARETELFLPKFKLETGYELIPPCRAMGMQDAFDASGKADFRGMGWPLGDLWISRIRHKAFVEVNEEGTEAAAATAVAMVTKALPGGPVFRADHPFLFLIRDNATGAILFLGRMADPRGH